MLAHCRLFSLMLSGILAFGAIACAGETERVKGFLGEKALRVLSAPDRVEVIRVTAPWDKVKYPEKFAGYPLVAKMKDQGPEFAGHLGEVLRNDQSYEWSIHKACELDPGVGYRVWRGKESVALLICFHCDQLAVIPDESTPKKWQIGEIDPAHAALVKLAKQAFPDDKVIQGLKD